MKKIARWATEQALRVALRKPAPGTFSMTGPSVYKRDFISAHLVDSEDHFVFLARSINSEYVDGLWFAPDRAPGTRGEDRKIPLSELGQYRFYAEYYCREHEQHYRSAWFYLWWGEPYAYARLWWQRGNQWIFNQKPLARKARFDVLHHLIQGFLTTGRESWPTVQVITSIYGPRWIRHPAKDEIKRHYQMILRSLEDSGDLKFVSSQYQLQPHAMVTLHQYETEEQRHADMKWQAILMFILTVCLVVIGIIQAGAAVVEIVQGK